MAIADAAGFPVSAHIESASTHELKLVEATINNGFTQYAPDRIAGDKAYDSDGLDEQLLDERGIELIAPHRENRRKQCTQDGRKLRRYKRRWKVNVCSLGFKTSDVWVFATNTMLKTSLL